MTNKMLKTMLVASAVAIAMVVVPGAIVNASSESITGGGVGDGSAYTTVTYGVLRTHAASGNDGKISFTGSSVSSCHGGDLDTTIISTAQNNLAPYEAVYPYVLHKYSRLVNGSYDWPATSFYMRAHGSVSGCANGATFSGVLKY